MSHPLLTAALGVGLVAAAVVAAGCEPTDPMVRGRERYNQCAPCHGMDGAGKPELEAPPIAGLPLWYMQAQLEKFRYGIRGTHFDDAGGMRMRPMSLSMPTDRDVKEVLDYVATLPVPAAMPATLADASADRGKASFATCVACHGVDGGGNQALNAPSIAGQPDWYVFLQLGKFKKGIRGKHPKDATGATMQAISVTLATDAQMKDVAAYVASLPRKKG